MTEEVSAPVSNAPVGDAPAGTPEAPAAPAAPAAAPAAEQPFYGSFQDPNLKTWAEGKGWKSPEAAVKSAYHLEKMVGAPADSVLRIPQEGDADGWKAVYEKLGAPHDVKDYNLPGVGDDPASQAYANHMRDVFKNAGLSTKQVETVLNANNEFNEQYSQQQSTEYDQEIQAAEQTLKKEWGNGYNVQLVTAQQAAQNLGFTEGMLNGLEQAVGYAETMKFMAELGSRLGEDSFVGGSGETPGAIGASSTPAQAQAAWETFKSDPANVAALTDKRNPGHAAAMARKNEIFAIMHPDRR